MGLARVTNQLSTVIVRRLGDDGGTLRRDVEAELDNLIAWAKSAVRCIHVDTSTVGNVGAGLDSLHSYTLDTPNRLNTDGDYLRVRYAGVTANNDTDKQIRFSFDGQVALSFGAVIDLDATSWVADLVYTRLSATSVRVTVNSVFGQLRMADGVIVTSPTGSFIDPQVNDLTVSNLNNNAVTLLVQGEGGANDDVQQKYSLIELRQQ